MVIVEDFTRPSHKLVESLSAFTSALLSDAMSKMNTMSVDIKPLLPGVKIAGPALTVRSIAADFLTPIRAIDYAKPGDIIVVDVRGFKGAAVWGEIASASAKQWDVGGAVIDGSIRDVAGIREMGFQIFHGGVVPNAGDASALCDINIPITCGGVTVKPGDIIVGDDDGVVSIPLERAEVVLEKARRQHQLEEEILRKLGEGKTVYKALEEVLGGYTITVGKDIEIP
ncbi:MAG: RraA family protein [Candidatus Geothermarchaeales archaeon]